MAKQPPRTSTRQGANRSGNTGSHAKRPQNGSRGQRTSEKVHTSQQRPAAKGASQQTARKRKTSKAKKRRQKKIALFVVEIAVLLVLLVGLFLISKLNRIDRQGIKIGDLDINELDSETREILEGYTTIALFGIDNHDAGNFATGRTDTIMIACINNDTKEVKICSVYRDTYLNIGDGIYTKCNAAYQNGGPAQAISMLDNNMDLEITDYVTVDFNAMVDIIDTLGGITLTITQEELEAMCGTHRVGYDDAGNPIYEQSENYLETVAEAAGQEPNYDLVAGTQNCSGVTAVAYCRVRYTSGDDYRRSERQREVISQILQKAKSSDLGTVNKAVNIALDEISTSYRNDQILALATQMMNYNLTDSAGFPFYKNTKSMGNSGSCVIPCDLNANVEHLHLFLYGDADYTPTDTVKAISAEIVNRSGYTRDDADDRLYGSVTEEDPAPTGEEEEGN